MRKLLSTAAAIVLAGGIAYAASIPYLTGAYDPGNAVGTFNQVIANTIFGVEGMIGYVNGPIGSPATVTTPQLAAQAIIPTGQLQTGGQGIRATCSGEAAADAAGKVVWLSIGNSGEVTAGSGGFGQAASANGSPGVLASASFGTVTGTAWTIQARLFVGNGIATQGSAATPNSFDGFILVPGSTTTSFVFAGPDTIDNVATGLAVQCGFETVAKADVTVQTFVVEQIK